MHPPTSPQSLFILLPLLAFFLLAGCHPAKPIDPFHLQVFQPLPDRFDSAAHPSTPEKIALGRLLFFETRLSLAQDLSCQSCHPLDRYGVDGEKLSKGHRGLLGSRNSPTVWNAAGQMAQFWDGRAQTVEAQAMGPVLNPVEMAMPSEGHALTVLASIPGYVVAFRGAFPSDASPINAENFGKAIGAFERQLLTPSRWDRYLSGDPGALSRVERAGLKTFIDYSCQTCHNGALLGGNSHQKLGMIKPWPDTNDLGRFAITRVEADRYSFKVASLRNVTKTAPYFHDGSMPTLEGAVEKMAEHQLGKKIPRGERDLIIRFLGALTGELQAALIQTPTLPASGPSTPAPIR